MKDETEESIRLEGEFVKFDQGLGLVFGWAIISKKEGADYVDLQNDIVPDEALMEAAVEFVHKSVLCDMHVSQDGSTPFIFPMTEDVKKSLGLSGPMSGLIVGVKPSEEALAMVNRGERVGFSIGGVLIESEEV